jgi:hypothetical protein
MKLTEAALRNKFLTEYKNFGTFDEFKNDYYLSQNLYRSLMFESFLPEEIMGGGSNEQSEKTDVIKRINNNDFEINNYEKFLEAIQSNKRKEFLTPYALKDLQTMTTYKLNGYNIGYAIKEDGDIVSVFNNSNVKNIGSELIKSAIKNGGNKLDHYDGYLSSLYEPLGFKEVGRDKWDDKYASSNWDYEKYGRPDIIYRQLKNN